MDPPSVSQEAYFQHLKNISLWGRLYKKFFVSPVLYYSARHFGSRIVEVGSGTGNGILGAYPSVFGLDINPMAVNHCKAKGLNADLINADGTFPIRDATYDVCVLDNVLEHIADPTRTLDECCRVTKRSGGLVISVPGQKGFDADSDHKLFYDKCNLPTLDVRWKLTSLFSIPFFLVNEKASQQLRQYCLVAVYRKVGL